MDVDFKTPPKDENSTTEDSQKTAPIGDTNGSAKDNGKHSIKLKRGRTRSRSSTPQKKVEEQKTLHVSITKIENELNGKDLTEETEKTDEKIESKGNDKEQADISKDKAEVEEVVNKEEPKKQNGNTQKDEEKPKDEKLKKDESPKKDVSKKDTVTKKIGTPKKNSPKRDSPKKGSSPKQKNESPKREKRAKKQESSQPSKETETDTVEMDPLVISDEPDPELEFDENSDLESGKGSPIFARCVTRRSQTRNIPTPKTPKSIDQDVDSEKNSSTYTPTEMIENDVDVPKTDNFNNSHDSTETTNVSTRAVVGSDTSRTAYIETHDSNFTDDSYLNASRERSLGETLRCLSARRPIRSTEDYRKRVLRTNQDKSDLNMPYSSRNSVEQISGVKRKSRSSTPEERKKFKSDSPVVNSLFSSPLSNFRNKFRSDLPSSTPKLLGYKETSGLHYSDDEQFAAVQNGDDEKKSWCSIM